MIDLAATLPSGSYPALVGLVLLGSIIPVVPTGALVSAAAAAAVGDGGYASLALIIAVSTVGAFIGDVATFALCRLLGDRALRWFRQSREPGQPSRLAAAEERLVAHRISVLVVARLIPAGRIPVLLAAGLSRISWRMFITAQLVAGLIWAAMYAGIGLAGGTIFDETWQAVLAALVIVVALTVVPRWIQQAWQRRRSGD